MSSDKKYSWYKIADSVAEIRLNASGMAEMEAGGKKLCIALHREQVFACATKCPHAGGALSAGFIDPLGNIVCPLHRYKFSLSRGHNVSGEGYYLKTYPVEVRPDGVFVGIEAGGLLNWLK